jgi:hypothetical protein
MVKNAKLLEKFEKNQLQKGKVDIEKNLKIAEAMYQQAVLLKKFRTKKSPEQDRIIYKIAKVINSV